MGAFQEFALTFDQERRVPMIDWLISFPDLCYFSSRRPFRQLAAKRFQGIRFSGRINFHAAVAEILDVATNPQAFGFSLSEKTESHALHSARNQISLRYHHRRFQSVRASRRFRFVWGAILRRPLVRVKAGKNRLPDPLLKHRNVFHEITRRLHRFVKRDTHYSRFNCQPAFGHNFAAARDGNWNDSGARPDRHNKNTFLKRQQFSVSASRAFWKNKKRMASVERGHSLVDRTGRFFAAFAIHGNKTSQTHGVAQNRQVKKLLLGQNQHGRQESEDNGWITIALMVHHKNHGSAGANFLPAVHLQPHASQPDRKTSTQNSNPIDRIGIPR